MTTSDDAESFRPEVLFLCVHNTGRSQMAAAFARQLGKNQIVVHSAGSAPGEDLNLNVVEAMRERGIDISNELPRALTDEMARNSDVIVTMGCGDACPVYLEKRYLDWELTDPAGKTLDQVRIIRDKIESHVKELLQDVLAQHSPNVVPNQSQSMTRHDVPKGFVSFEL
jgi:protein-tyrosine-phosphatase